MTSDGSGHYEAKDLDWGHYRIHFGGRSPSFNDEDVYGFFVSNGSKRMLDVALTGGMPAHLGAISKVRGVVTDEAGEPTAGATVVIVPLYGPSLYRQQYTDEDGAFVYGVEDGSYLIYATAPGAVSEPILFKTRGVETRGTAEKIFTLKLLPSS
ncbi:MAG TPA: carboxypeptidase-like regulatory domain-containing protein [Acidobacteriota bacterium]|nr:carboxypeptidase-like regulatory domain-containing protein [Acidobacteriota bacterium]